MEGFGVTMLLIALKNGSFLSSYTDGVGKQGFFIKVGLIEKRFDDIPTALDWWLQQNIELIELEDAIRLTKIRNQSEGEFYNEMFKL